MMLVVREFIFAVISLQIVPRLVLYAYQSWSLQLKTGGCIQITPGIYIYVHIYTKKCLFLSIAIYV